MLSWDRAGLELDLFLFFQLSESHTRCFFVGGKYFVLQACDQIKSLIGWLRDNSTLFVIQEMRSP